MILKYFKLFLLIIIVALTFIPYSFAQSSFKEGHINVSLRMIGHQILLNYGDSTSRVLPIEKENERYKVQFESEFEIQPEELIQTTDKIVKESNIANDYLVEIEHYDSRAIVYSYETRSIKIGQTPCRSRSLPLGCYTLFFTILDSTDNIAALPSFVPSMPNGISIEKSALNKNIVLFTSLLFFMLGFVFYKTRKETTNLDPDLINIGSFVFNKRNMILSNNHNSIELSSKESDLLVLLFSAANTTLKRENILNVVWGDEGNYIGRTLDVFISKLRKKLASDESLKIVNIRGVGYKFIVND